MSWGDLISLAFNIIFGSGFLVMFITLRAQRRKANADAGIREIDLKQAEISVNKLLEEADREQALSIISELRDTRRLLHEALEKQTVLELRVVEWERRALIAEKKLAHSRCDVFDCTMRIPPFPETI